jgi:hypothetical protein
MKENILNQNEDQTPCYNQKETIKFNSPNREDIINNSFGQHDPYFGNENNEELSGFGLGELNRNTHNYYKNEEFTETNTNVKLNYKDKYLDNNEDVKTFKLDDRIQFLMKYLDFFEYSLLFIQNKINFNDLLLITKEDFIEMKIPVGPRNRILKFISDYKIYAKNYTLDEIKFFLTKNDTYYVNNQERNNLIEDLNPNNKNVKNVKKGDNYQYNDEVFSPSDKGNNEQNYGPPFFASNQTNNILANFNTDMLNSIQNENNSKDESLKMIDLSNDEEKKKKKNYLNKNLHLNGEVFENSLKFSTIPEKDDNNIPTKDATNTKGEKESQIKREYEILTSNLSKSTLKKFNENKALKKDFQTVNDEVK